MESKVKPFLKHALLYGLYLAGISTLLMLIYYVLNLNILNWMFSIFNLLVSIGISATLIVIATSKYRKQFLNGKIKYLQCVMMCFSIILVSGWIVSFISFLFYNYFDPEYMPKQVEAFLNQMQAYNLPQEDMDKLTSKMAESINPVSQFTNSLIYVPIMAAIISLIVSLFIKKTDNTFESNFE